MFRYASREAYIILGEVEIGFRIIATNILLFEVKLSRVFIDVIGYVPAAAPSSERKMRHCPRRRVE